MILDLNKRVQSIPVFQTLLKLLESFSESEVKEVKTIEDIWDRSKIKDPVREFIEFYNWSSRSNLSKGTEQYLINALYGCKGSPRIFDIFEEVLGINIEYNYDFPKLTIVRFNRIKSSDIVTFLTKFEDMIYYLIYYTEIKIELTNLDLLIEDKLVSDKSILCIQYNYDTNRSSRQVEDRDFI